MYNINYHVKYHDIKQELLLKLSTTIIDNPKYSKEDINDICHKLYMDEMVSVFGAINILDDKIDVGIKQIYEILSTNNDFNLLFNEFTHIFVKNMTIYEINNINNYDNLFIKQSIITSLFSPNLFYITHKCICQQIKSKEIQPELLQELKTQFVLFSNQSYL